MKRTSVYCTLVICFVILAACGQTDHIDKPVNPATVITTNLSSPTPKNTMMITSTVSIIPPKPTETFQPPTVTLQPMLTSTRTLQPTLPADQAQALALKMIQTNGNCSLPCWLGIEPGKTTWDDANNFLNTFAANMSILSDDVHGVIFKFPKNTYRVDKTGATIYVRNGIIDQIRAPEDLSLPDLLTNYGAPTEIRIHAIGYDTIDPIGRFTLVLFYQDQGIMAVYDGSNEKAKTIHICPNHIQGPQQTWLLWSPDDSLTFAEAGRKTLLISPYPPPAESDYIPLVKLSNLSIDTFTQRYKDPKNQSVCMEMPAPDWP
jgi:hypothetical protein